MPQDCLLLLNTCPDAETAERLATLLVENKLAACVNIVSGLTSVYRWQGKLHRDQEHLLIIKSTQARYGELERLLVDNHPYELPELVAVPIEQGLTDYLAWITDMTSTPQ